MATFTTISDRIVSECLHLLDAMTAPAVNWGMLLSSSDVATPEDWILQMAGEVADELMGYLLGTDDYPDRERYMAYSAALNYGDVIPAHTGPLGHVVVESTLGAGYRPGVERPLEAIERVKRSTLSRVKPVEFYHIRDGSVIFFTGSTAKVYIATFNGASDLETLELKHVPAVVAGILRYAFAQGGGNLDAAGHFDGIYRWVTGLLIKGLEPQMPKPYGAPKEGESS